MSELTEYEKQRLAQIAKNKELLQSLQIDRDSRRSRDGTPEGKPKPRKPAAPRRKAPAAASEPLRVSTRSRTQRTAALASVDPEAAKRKREEEEEEAERAEAARKLAKHANREIECWNPSGRFVIEEAALPLRETLQSIAGSGSWKRQLHGAIKPEANGTVKVSPTTPVTTSKRAPSSRNTASTSRSNGTSNGKTSKAKSRKSIKEESDSDVDYDMSEHVQIGLKSLRKTFENMSMREVKKITPDRVYSLAVHPTVDKDLVFVGDRKGWLGIWNASADDPANADDTKDDEHPEASDLDRNAFVQRVYNDHGTISCVKLDPIKAHTVYTSSYDCTLRSLNFEVGVWSEVVDVDRLAKNLEGEGEALISAFEVTHDGNEVWLSDNRGGATHADLRAPPKSHKRWKIAESKVGCISLNPANEHIFATSHLLRDVRIWDARYLKDMNPKTTIWQDSLEEACLALYTHGKAVSAAYFDPSGRHLSSTCYDDRIRVWDVNPSQLTKKGLGKFEPDHSFYHDNNTGAYTSVFKATWSSNPIVEPYMTVGNMSRTLDIYSKEGSLITQLKEGLTSVPAVTCGHPSQPVLFAGAAGGKVYYWKANKWERS